MAFTTHIAKPLGSADDAIVPLARRLGTISGVVFDDVSGDGIQDPGEAGLRNRFVFLDYNHNGILDEGEASARTRADGSYTIRQVAAGDYDIVETVPKGWHATYPFVEGDFYSASAVQNKFVEIAHTKTEMIFNDNDDGYAFLEAVDGVTFYGQSHVDIGISVNGFITFASNPTDRAYLNQQLADPTTPNSLIAPLWDDYVLGDKGKVYGWDDTLHGRVIIEWKNVSLYNDNSGAKFTFETILSNDGSIKFMYKDVPLGGTATIGVENDSGTVATQLSFNEPVDPTVGYVLRPTHIEFGKTTILVGAGAVLTGIDFGQTRNVHPAAFGPDQHVAPAEHAVAHPDLALVHLV